MTRRARVAGLLLVIAPNACFFSLDDVVTKSSDGRESSAAGAGGASAAGSGGAAGDKMGGEAGFPSASGAVGSGGSSGASGGGGGRSGAGGMSDGTCGCYDGDQDAFYCGAATQLFAKNTGCVPPDVALSHPGDLLSCNGGHWTVGATCANGCMQVGGDSTPDRCK